MTEAQALYALQQGLNALQVSAFYALLAVSYVVLHGVTNRFNLAVGAIATWAGAVAIGLAGTVLDETFHGPAVALLVALLGAGCSAAGIGLLVGRSLLPRLMKGPPLATLVATLGLALALEEALRLATGSAELWLPPIWAEAVITVPHATFPVRVTAMQLAVFAACLVLAGMLALLMTRLPFGRDWRATADDPLMAALLGIDIRRVVIVSSVLASLYAASTGFLIAAYYGNIGFHNGFLLGLKALFVAVIGGLSSFPGAIAGGFLVGVFETAWSATLPITWRDGATFVALTGLLVWRRSTGARESRVGVGRVR